MNAGRAITGSFALASLSLLAACSFNDHANHARGCAGCAAGQCVLGYCLQRAFDPGLQPSLGDGAGVGGLPTTGSGGNGATNTATNGTGTLPPPGPCAQGMPCYLGPAATRGVGTCRAGTAQCQGTVTQSCAGEVLPTNEACNGLDDDCDGKVDEEIMLGSCTVAGSGACAAGALHCEGAVQTCVAQGGPAPEVCNGIDDDCDGVVDNDSQAACYPAGAAGCTAKADGTFDCLGVCKAGTATCKDGHLEACANFVQPSTEVCGGSQAADEDCDGQVDDGCPCTGNQSQPCYPGSLFTLGVGRCKIGAQQCVAGAFGPCQGAIVPVAESCQNQGADDDCNFLTDDIPGLNASCTVMANRGVCRYGSNMCVNGALTCVTPAKLPQEIACDGRDENCDGLTDEIYNLATDAANCGACGQACATGELCCGGSCHNPATDVADCGACGNACGDGNACCGGTCVATTSNDHCGACGGCGQGQACCGGACVATNTTDHCGGCGGCSQGEACCGGACVPIGTTDHCGGCGGCGQGQACCGGTCVANNTNDHCGGCNACNPGDACCGGACVATNTTDHCGGCNACSPGDACCGGACVATNTTDHCGGCNACSPGDACCGGACVATNTTDHCGGCNACNPGDACCSGGCLATNTNEHCGGCNACPQGQSCCGSMCADLMTDSGHCGQCGTSCSSACTCVGGVCQDGGGAACQ